MVRKKQTFIHNDAMVDRPPSEDAEEVNINPNSLFILVLHCVAVISVNFYCKLFNAIH